MLPNENGPRVTSVTGNANTWETRIRFGSGRRKRFVIQHCRTEAAALERARSMSEIADKLVAAGKSNDAWRLRKHVLPIIGHLPVKDITLDDVDQVMAAMPRKLSRASLGRVAQILVRLMHLATYPARLRTASPIPRGWLPKLGKKVNYPILIANKDAALLRQTAIPINRRLEEGSTCIHFVIPTSLEAWPAVSPKI